MILPPVKTLHRQPRLPLTPNNLLWAMVIGVLVMLASALVYLRASDNSSISIGGAGVTAIDATAAQLYSADPDKREQAIASLGLAAQSGSGEATSHLETFFQSDTYLTANGLIYAATQDGLYAIRDSSHWKLVDALPGYPTSLAVGGLDGQVAYVGTLGSGPFRSIDGGQTWERILTGLPAAEQLSVTALTISADSNDAQDVKMALSVTVGTTELHTTPLGIFRTTNGGANWAMVAPGSAANNY